MGTNKTTWGLLYRFMKAGSKLLWLILLLYAVSIGMDLFPPFFQQIYTDDIITGKNPSWFEPLLWVFAALFVLELIAWVVLNSHRRTLSMHFSLVSQSRYVWHVLRLPMSAFSRFSTGDLMARYMSISRVGVKLFVAIGYHRTPRPCHYHPLRPSQCQLPEAEGEEHGGYRATPAECHDGRTA